VVAAAAAAAGGGQASLLGGISVSIRLLVLGDRETRSFEAYQFHGGWDKGAARQQWRSGRGGVGESGVSDSGSCPLRDVLNGLGTGEAAPLFLLPFSTLDGSSCALADGEKHAAAAAAAAWQSVGFLALIESCLRRSKPMG
jgi:hypothetical protein